MDRIRRRTVRHGVVGAVVGTILGYVPLILLVAPLVGGGVAGYLERDGARQGAIAGLVAGALMAAFSTMLTATVLFVRFGDLPFAGLSGSALVVPTLLSLVASLGQLLVAGIGGGLGGVLEADRRAATTRGARDSLAEPRHGRRTWPYLVGSVVVGFAAFVVVAIAVTVVLEPFIWLSLLVGLPVGVVVGAAVAVLGYHFLTRRPEDRVDWRTVGIGALAVVVVFALVLGGLSLLGQQRVTETTDSTYEYRVTLSADDTLENATVYVPVPVDDGASKLGERLVDNPRYERYTPAVQGVDAEPTPVNFTYELVETAHGPMLAVSADRIEVSQVYYREVENETMGWRERIDESEYDPDDPSMGVQHDGSFTFTVTMVANDSIDTADPFGNEPLLSAQSERTETDCLDGSETQRCYDSDGWVYADYRADPGTTVYVSAEINGRNEWFAGGWTGNEYREWSRTELHGQQSGWYVTEGELEVGVGRYR